MNLEIITKYKRKKYKREERELRLKVETRHVWTDAGR